MDWFDSHLHFDDFAREGVVEDILDRAGERGVRRMVAIGGTPDANRRAVDLAASHPDRIVASVGLDRDEVGKPVDADALREWTGRPGVVAIGETGLDYHYGADQAQAQRSLFDEMLDLAAETTRPVVIHSREADADTLDRVRHHLRNWRGDAGRVGVLHCFTGSRAFAHACIDLGLYISFSGIVTFKRSEDLRAVARGLPADRLLVETDAPYLAPVPHRGTRNEPAHVALVGEALAALREESPALLARTTFRNAEELFGLHPAGVVGEGPCHG